MESDHVYPNQPPLSTPAYKPYQQGAIPMQPMQAPPAPEVVHQRERNRDNASDSESEEETDQKSPGDIPQRYLNVCLHINFNVAT